ncbi:MAG: transporter substrate-binding domain-containing protein [Clostridia bacterium]|nr:transporter substrate-binding domain-containing protein [Clostridia bacterium]
MYQKKKTHTATRITLLFLSVLTVLTMAAIAGPVPSVAQETGETIRVGWHEEPYFITDEYGRRSGYSYEYQCKLAAYTGWNYEYVKGTWSELLQMLKDGEIDMMSNVSYSEARTKDMLFSSMAMGTESYYIFVSPENTEITTDDYSSLEGKKVGVTRGSIQGDLFKKWAKMHNITVLLYEMSIPEEEARKLIGSKLDAFVTVDVYGDSNTAVPLCKIGSSDYYFAVSKNRPDLLPVLDAAMNSIQDENKYYNEQLSAKYLDNLDAEHYLTAKEKQWLLEHGTIRVGYQDNYLAFCASDPETGELTGALKTYLEYAADALKNAHISFKAIAYPTASAAIAAMKNGEVDCVFPANLTDYASEEINVVTTTPLMRTEMDAVVKASEKKEFIVKEDVTVAVNEGNTNYDMWLSDNFPTWARTYYEDTSACLEAVAAGKADCVIISSYRYSNISKQCEKLHLSSVYTGVDMDYSFALRKGDTMLYTIITKVNNAVPGALIHTALTYYSTEDVKTTFADFIKDNLFIVLTIIAAILVVILLLLLHSIRAERKLLKEERLVKSLNKRVFVDPLTSVRNKGAFYDYIESLQERINQEEKFDFAIGVFDCNNLKQINDRYGHDRGDEYIKGTSRLICQTFQHSPVFRIGGDEFAVILENDDFKKRDEIVQKFEERQHETCASEENPWDQVQVAMGLAVYDPNHDRTVNETARRADKIMYENKRLGKAIH